MIRKVLEAMLLVFAVAAIDLSSVHAGEPPGKPERDQVVKFLRDKVIGKTLETKSTSQIANGKVEAVFEARRTFSSLVKTNEGFTFDILIAIKQTNYDMDDQGNRIGASHKKNRTYVSRYLVGEKLSTGELIGTEVDVFSSDPDAYPYTPMVVRMGIEGDALLMDVDTVLYQDFYGKDDRFTPGALEIRYEFRTDKGRLVARQTTRAYDVDPKTLERRLQTQPRPVEVLRQVD